MSISNEAVEVATKVQRVLELIDDLFTPGYYPAGVGEAVNVLHEALEDARNG